MRSIVVLALAAVGVFQPGDDPRPAGESSQRLVRIAEVRVVGLERLDETTVRPRMGVSVGEKIDPSELPSLIANARRRLREMGVFRRVDVSAIPIGADAVKIEATVEEPPRLALGSAFARILQIAHSNNVFGAQGSIGLGAFVHTGNVFYGARAGTEQGLSIVAPSIATSLDLSASFEYVDPVFTERLDDLGRAFDTRSVGGTVGLAWTLGDFNAGLAAGGAFEQLRIDGVEDTIVPALGRVFLRYGPDAYALRLEVTGAQDTRSDRRWVTSRAIGTARVEIADDHLLATQLWFGNVSPDTPLMHRWALATARGVRAPPTEKLFGRHAGRVSVEYRWRALTTDIGMAELDAELALFVDAGVAENTVAALFEDTPIVAAGPAFRITLGPPLGLDLAVEVGISTIGEQVFVTTERSF